jgi:hypothetical protein
MTQRPRTSTSTPPTAYNPHWSHRANASDPTLTLGLGRPPAPRSHSDRYGIQPRRSTQPAHYPPSPAMLSSESASGSSSPKTALKVFTSVKRSFSMAVTKKSGPSASVRAQPVCVLPSSDIRCSLRAQQLKRPPRHKYESRPCPQLQSLRQQYNKLPPVSLYVLRT